MTEVHRIRHAILGASLETSSYGEEPNPKTLYVPPSHLKALRLEANVVIGGRGVGKSFWTAALHSPALRSTLGVLLPELDNLDIEVGFSNKANKYYPNEDHFDQMLDENIDPYDIWRAVIMRWVARSAGTRIPEDSWQTTVQWLRDHPDKAEQVMQAPRNRKGLILFDALDRSNRNWQRMDDIVRGLLRALLWLKSFHGLYGKVFLREDQAERTVFNFPDASKLKATKAELSWARHDLHGLLWQRLINAPLKHGQVMRDILSKITGQNPREQQAIWQLSEEMKRETETQKRAFEYLAGPWMGKDRRRGVPYTWSVSHLADCRGQTSPRSFLAAIRQATEDSAERYPDHEFPLHYESIKRGIQKASDIRVDEVAEDYPWVQNVLEALSGMNVPCEYEIIRGRWETEFPGGTNDIPSERLPAQHAQRGWDGIREDLHRLGMIETKKDGRVDMPDLYRVGFRLGRKGGVKPKN